MENIPIEDLVTVPVAAVMASTSRETIWNWIEAGRIKAYRIGGKVFLDRNEVQAYNQESLRSRRRQAAIARNSKAS